MIIQRYPTRRRSLLNRVVMTVVYSAQRSWYPALCFYAVLAAVLFAINYKG